MDVKRCPRCGETKPRDAFTRNPSNKDGLGSYCRPCHSIVSMEHADRLYGGHRNFLAKLRYGIDLEEIERLKAEQGGKCAICGKRPAKHVDQCHDSKKVRQILCFSCNRGLGKFKDSPLRMKRAIEYLSKL